MTRRWDGANTRARAVAMERQDGMERRAAAFRNAAWLGLLTMIVAALTLAASVAWAKPVPDTFADLVEKLSPAVVNISTTQKVEGRGGRSGPGGRRGGPQSPFDEFFRDFFERGPSMQAPQREVHSLGSGFVIDPRGYIVTNNHVVGDATDIQVNFDSGLTLSAEIVGKDEATDLAVIKVEHDEALPVVDFGDSDGARVGDWVLAIGNPFSLGRSVTAGIISARNRDINAGAYDDFIQTDAAINRGNSGGPLFDSQGKVIGVNTVIISPSGGSIGIGFAISSALAQNVVDQLIKHGETRRGWLGVRIQLVSEELATSFGLDKAKGALVAGVNEEGPAAKGGLKVGDVILEFDGKDVDDYRQLSRTVASTEIGKRVKVVVWRDGQNKTLRVKLGKLDPKVLADLGEVGADDGDAGGERELADLGITVAPVTTARAEQFDLEPDTKGVLITEVDPSGPAGRRLRPGDIIVEVDQDPVDQPKDVAAKLGKKSSSKKELVLFLLKRAGQLSFVTVRLNEDE